MLAPQASPLPVQHSNQRTKSTGSHQFHIHNFRMLLKTPAGTPLPGPHEVFECAGRMWRLNVYPNQSTPENAIEHPDHLSVMVSASPNASVDIYGSIGLKAEYTSGDSGPTPTLLTSTRTQAGRDGNSSPLITAGKNCGWREFLSRADLEDKLSLDGTLILTLDLEVFSEPGATTLTAAPSQDAAPTAGSVAVARDLGAMLDSGTGSDVTFLVGGAVEGAREASGAGGSSAGGASGSGAGGGGGGEEMRAHRAVLIARSPVFAAMLSGYARALKQRKALLSGRGLLTTALLTTALLTTALLTTALLTTTLPPALCSVRVLLPAAGGGRRTRRARWRWRTWSRRPSASCCASCTDAAAHFRCMFDVC